MRTLYTILVAASSLAAQSGLGSIQGIAVDPEARVVPRAVVSIHRVFDREQPLLRYSDQQFTNENGSFQFSGVPAGRYNVCLQAPGSDMLNPCQWTPSSAPVVTAQAGTPVNAGAIRFARGSRLRVLLEDAGKLLRKHANKEPGADVHVMVLLPSGFRAPMTLVGDEEAGWEHEMVVPAGVPIQLQIASEFFDLTDDSGVPFDKKSGKHVTLASAMTGGAETVKFKVTGAKKNQ